MTASLGISPDINVSPSRRLATVLAVSHAGALACLFIAPAPLAVKLALPLAVAASFVHCLRRYALLIHRRSVRRLVFGDTHRRLFFNGQAQGIDIELLPGTVNTRRWVILRAKANDGRRLALPLAPDMMNIDQWRRLRVWLNVRADVEGGEYDAG